MPKDRTFEENVAFLRGLVRFGSVWDPDDPKEVRIAKMRVVQQEMLAEKAMNQAMQGAQDLSSNEHPN